PSASLEAKICQSSARRETIDTPSDLITDFAGLVGGDIVTWRLSMPIVGLAAICWPSLAPHSPARSSCIQANTDAMVRSSTFRRSVLILANTRSIRRDRASKAAGKSGSLGLLSQPDFAHRRHNIGRNGPTRMSFGMVNCDSSDRPVLGAFFRP